MDTVRESELGPNLKMRLGVYVAITVALVTPLTTLILRVERINMRLDRIEQHITTDWTLGHMILWSARLAEMNRTNGVIVPSPESIKQILQP